MHAVRLHAFGAADNLRLEERRDPLPGPGELRIAVEASGIHLVDIAMRKGAIEAPFVLPELPTTLGREVAGAVDAVGTGVPETWLGRRVVAHLGAAAGGYAGRAVVAPEAVHEIGELNAGTAVAMIGTGRTAMAVLDVAAIRAEDVILVTSAAGGLGSLFVQAGRNAGAFVVGLAGGEQKMSLVTDLGADVAIDYRSEGWPDEVRTALGDRAVSVLLDGIGGPDGRRAFDLLGIGGRTVMYGYTAGAPTEFTTTDVVGRGLTATWAIGPRLLRVPGGLRALETRALSAAAAGVLTPVVQEFPLDEAAAAHRAIEERTARGKVVLTALEA
jgi:NADPH2:quinone reductase